MTEQIVNKHRRHALKLAAGSVIAIPLGGMLAETAIAKDLPPVTEDDPQAVALKYVADASKATRTDKSGTPGSEQTCKNCQLSSPAEGDQLSCQLFAGKSVSAGGWCTAWAKRVS